MIIMDSKESDKFTSDAIVRWEKVPASAQKTDFGYRLVWAMLYWSSDSSNKR
jgi:hypothetical protein